MKGGCGSFRSWVVGCDEVAREWSWRAKRAIGFRCAADDRGKGSFNPQFRIPSTAHDTQTASTARPKLERETRSGNRRRIGASAYAKGA